MLTLTATVKNVFPTAEFKDKMSGEVTPAGHKVQLEYREPVRAGGEKIVLKDFNVRGYGKVWQDAIGRLVTVGVGMYANDGKKAELYIPDGTLPTIHRSQEKAAA